MTVGSCTQDRAATLTSSIAGTIASCSVGKARCPRLRDGGAEIHDPDQVLRERPPASPRGIIRSGRRFRLSMKAIVYTETGDPSVLHLVDREVTPPAPGEVRVRVIVSGVNPTDWKSRRGAGPGQSPPFAEVTPNQDGAGVIDAVGDGVSDLAVGDRVWMYLAGHQRPTGTAQEYTNLPARTRRPAARRGRLRRRRQPRGARHDRPPGADGGRGRTAPAAAGRPRRQGRARRRRRRGGGSRRDPAGALGRGHRRSPRSPDRPRPTLATAAGAHHVVNYREQDAAAVIAEIAPDGVDLIVEVAIAANAELDQAWRSRGRRWPSTPTTAAAS